MAVIATRGYIEAGGDYYLCPLPATQLATGELESYLEPVWAGNQELTSIEYTYPNGEKKEIALGYCRSIPRTTSVNGSEVTWMEQQSIRRYGDRPARVIQSNSVQLSVTLDEAAVTNAIRMMGWRVYVTNQPQEALSLDSAVVAYREEYLIERGFRCCLNKLPTLVYL